MSAVVSGPATASDAHAVPRPRAADPTGRRSTLLREAALIVALYLGYVSVRLLADGDLEPARRHAEEILHV